MTGDWTDGAFQWHMQAKRLAEEFAGVKSQLPLAAFESTLTLNQ